MSGGAALATKGLVAGYGRDLAVVRGVDLEVERGAFVALLGPNGAGKSTLVKAIAGLVPVFDGTVTLDGRNITGMALHERVRHGLAFVPQTENVFATLTIRENLQIAAAVLPPAQRKHRTDAVAALFPDLSGRLGLRAGALSGGQRQMLAIARALLVEPAVLMLDEPSAGLSPRAVGEVFAQLKAINRTGVTIVLVEQNVKAALALADRAVILVEGRVAHAGTAAELAGSPRLAELYLGGHTATPGVPA